MIKKLFRKIFNLDKVDELNEDLKSSNEVLSEYESLLADYKYLLVAILLSNNGSSELTLFDQNIINLYDIDFRIDDDKILLELVTTQDTDEY